MSQQFLSKYFKRPGDNNDGPADSSKKLAAKEKVKVKEHMQRMYVLYPNNAPFF